MVILDPVIPSVTGQDELIRVRWGQMGAVTQVSLFCHVTTLFGITLTCFMQSKISGMKG